MISKMGKLLAAAALVLVMSGCFSTSWLITLRNNGSGSIEMEYRLDREVVGMMQGMGGEEAETETPMSSEELLDSQELDEMASSLGEGVRFVSAEPLPENESYLGYTAVFEFDDINSLGLDPVQGAPEQQAGEFEEEEEEPPFTFRFTPGRPAELEVMMAGDEDGAEEESAGTEEMPGSAEQENMAAMMKPYFRSMSFLVQLKIDGSIRNTNASYRDGNTITLMDMDMGKIVDDQQLFNKVMNSESGIGDEEMLAELERAGIRIESKDRITVRFR
jgi:hypothetical protein